MKKTDFKELVKKIPLQAPQKQHVQDQQTNKNEKTLPNLIKTTIQKLIPKLNLSEITKNMETSTLLSSVRGSQSEQREIEQYRKNNLQQKQNTHIKQLNSLDNDKCIRASQKIDYTKDYLNDNIRTTRQLILQNIKDSQKQQYPNSDVSLVETQLEKKIYKPQKLNKTRGQSSQMISDNLKQLYVKAMVGKNSSQDMNQSDIKNEKKFLEREYRLQILKQNPDQKLVTENSQINIKSKRLNTEQSIQYTEDAQSSYLTPFQLKILKEKLQKEHKQFKNNYNYNDQE